MYNRVLLLIILYIIISNFNIDSSYAQDTPQRMYVDVETENLRIAPQGNIIGTLKSGTEAFVVEEQGNWLRIQITGWIWKDSMTRFRPRDTTGLLRAQHILVSTREEATAILSELQAGKDFSYISPLFWW